jgi:hypothetical protein
MQVVDGLAEFGDPSVIKAKVGDTDLVIVRDGAVINAFAANCPPPRPMPPRQ